MANDWTSTTVGEFSPFKYGKSLATPNRMKGEIPVISSSGVSGKHNDALVGGPGVVIGRKGTVGSVTFSKVPFWPIDTAFYIEEEPSRSLEFTYYLLKTLGLDQMNSDSAVPGLNRAHAHTLKIKVPTLPEQKAIAHVLGTLDDKIENLRQQNEVLEKMAQGLFQSWFVDFDPVRAKLGGRQPSGLDKSTAAIFPAEFQDSSIGPIPKGWRVSTVGDELRPVLGGTPSRDRPDYWTAGSIPWINSGKTNEFRVIEPSEWITPEALDNSATKILPNRTTILAITGTTLGQVSIVEIACCANQSVVGLPAEEGFPTEFLYPWIKENIEKLISSQTGGAQQHINKKNVEELALLCPHTCIIDAYLLRAKPLFDQIAANCFRSKHIATMRDTILPKLISGEVRLPNIDTILKNAKGLEESNKSIEDKYAKLKENLKKDAK